MNVNFIDKPDSCVLDYLKAYSNFNSNVIQILDRPIIIRKDFDKLKDKVVILSGGGSGHEPAHSGFVGKGMLTAAVAGGVFASPPPINILEAIYQIGKISEKGVLLIVKNYTGDRVNFNIAAERARKLGISVEIINVGEDTALMSVNKACGRRGLAGTVLIHKIAGAMAENGKQLNEIKGFLNEILKEGVMGTIGISFTGCTLPGVANSSFKLADGMYELGLGIHGEAGVRKEIFNNAELLIKEMINHVTVTGFGHVQLINGDKIVVLVNNLGSCIELELFVIADFLIKYLEDKFNVIVQRGYCGNYVTSLQMYGISITILKVINDDILNYLDAPVGASGWNKLVYKVTNKNVPKTMRKPFFDNDTAILINEKECEKYEVLHDKDFQDLQKAILSACDALISQEKYLNDLDSEIGDSDCGTTFKRGATAVKNLFNSMNNKIAIRYIPVLLSHLSLIVETEMGGSSGGLLSLFFESLSRRYKENTKASWCDILLESAYVISEVGGAIEGDRTMLDVLIPVFKMWKVHAKDKIKKIIPILAETAQTASQSTIKMTPKAGRASYVKQSKKFEKYPDPGAEAINIIIKSMNCIV